MITFTDTAMCYEPDNLVTITPKEVQEFEYLRKFYAKAEELLKVTHFSCEREILLRLFKEET